MTRSQPRLAALRAGTLVAALLVAAGCSGTPPGDPPTTPATSSSGTTTGPTQPVVAPPPESGACRELDYSAISRYSNSDPTVPCTSPHTAYTFDVQTVPADVNVEGVSIGNKSIQDAASMGCRTAFNRFIGGGPATRALSRLSVTYFLPEQKDFDNGAHWVRCDVVALETASALAPLPDKLSGLLSDPKALDTYGVCSTGTPGAADSALVMCTQGHAYRALTTLRLGTETAPYPGVAVAGKGGQQRCSDYIANALGSADGYTYGWTYPTASDWAAGQRFGYCWQKTHH